MKAKEVAMVVAISVLAAFFVGLLYDAIIEEPQYETFCNTTQNRMKYGYPAPVDSGQVVCAPYIQTPTERTQTQQCWDSGGMPEFNRTIEGCDREFIDCNYCNKQLTEAQNNYSRTLFFVIAPIAIILIILGVYMSAEVIGTGFMFSGILLLIYSTMRYFSGMSKIFRVVVIGVELFLLLLISWKKLKK